MSEVILILGGTKEAAELASKLVAEKPLARVISSLAGRTKEPSPPMGEVRVGGFGGAAGLAQFIKDNHVTLLIDATHPFAKNISQNAQRAAAETGVRFQTLTRQPWEKQHGDQWIEVPDLVQARDKIPVGARVLLALGSQHIDLFKTRNDVHFLVRMVDAPPVPPALPNHVLEIGKPGDLAHERELLMRHEITHIVCRNSGGQGAYAKIEAARELYCVMD
ncbi:MAG: cobalt-precorrin-6A reductase [Ahrensia sp.]|nr:cobalt-precorrin-6A reductase [Ahrensia sp.]